MLDLRGTLTVSTTGTYTFTNNIDDGGEFFLNGTGSAGSGTGIAANDGTHGPVVATGTQNLTAGTLYPVEFIYYNQGCAGDGCGGSVTAGITGPGTVSLTPEPAALSLLAVAALGIASRRR